MSDRILVIGKGYAQTLSPDIISHFGQLKLIMSGGQNNLPIETVQQLMFLQSMSQIRIDFVKMDCSDANYNSVLAYQLGLYMNDRENEVALLSDDNALDPVLDYARAQGYKIQRMPSGGSPANFNSAPVAMQQRSQPVQQPAPQPAPAPAPQPAQEAAPAPAAQPEQKKAGGNKRLISSLIGGSSGLMGN